ncbi:hypothetical protein BBD42_05905 [Paenibacillus sp. BIHB 4019]|uniref:Uncharacterized protein n=1 Tax=Paenibacillus sp. BIHB 4019 TaxID=1870819 RepID=A0A1B2DEB4_9BACL|nr:hypothetical protein BBD42_05905 [Paenibacillus sp. BIHB 4019]
MKSKAYKKAFYTIYIGVLAFILLFSSTELKYGVVMIAFFAVVFFINRIKNIPESVTFLIILVTSLIFAFFIGLMRGYTVLGITWS